jgi:hypothetical protein
MAALPDDIQQYLIDGQPRYIGADGAAPDPDRPGTRAGGPVAFGAPAVRDAA